MNGWQGTDCKIRESQLDCEIIILNESAYFIMQCCTLCAVLIEKRAVLHEKMCKLKFEMFRLQSKFRVKNQIDEGII